MASIEFDSSGFSRLGEGQWFNPDNRDVIVLADAGPLPATPVWLDDFGELRRELSRLHGQTGCLIEADEVTLDGQRALYTLVKERIPGSKHERDEIVVRAAFVIAKATATVVLKGQFEEWGITGERETAVLVALGGPEFIEVDGVPAMRSEPHPYAPDVPTALPYLRADEPAWDAMFPSHQLSLARAWTRRVLGSAVVAPALAALPDLRATPDR